MRLAWLLVVTACAPKPPEPCTLVALPSAVIAGSPAVVEFTGKCPAFSIRNALRREQLIEPSEFGATSVSFANLAPGLYELGDGEGWFLSFVVYEPLSTEPEVRIPARCFLLGMVDGGFGCGDRRYGLDAGFGPREVPDGGYVPVDQYYRSEIYGYFERCGRPIMRGFRSTVPDSGVLTSAACSSGGVFAQSSASHLTRTQEDGGSRVDELPFPTTVSVAMRFVGERLMLWGARGDELFGQYWCKTESALGELVCARYFNNAVPQAAVGFDLLFSTGTAFGRNVDYLGSDPANMRALPPFLKSTESCYSGGLELAQSIGFLFDFDDYQLCVHVDEGGAYGVRNDGSELLTGGILGPYQWVSLGSGSTVLYRIPGR